MGLRFGYFCLFTAFAVQAQVKEARLFEPELFPPATSFGTAFAPDGKTVYAAIVRGDKPMPTLVASHLRDGKWTAPETLPFSGQYPEGDPAMSPDGKRLYFWSLRPTAGKPANQRVVEIWYAERSGEGWSEPRSAGANKKGEWTPLTLATGGPTLAANGTLYCFRVKDKVPRLVRSRLVNGIYKEFEDLGDVINSGKSDLDPYVAPDESYLIFTSKRGGGETDLYISFRRDGAWTAPRSLGPKVNSDAAEYCPSVSPDGKRLFFTRDKQGIFFIETSELGIAGLGGN